MESHKRGLWKMTEQERIDELTKELESYKYSFKMLCELYFEDFEK